MVRQSPGKVGDCRIARLFTSLTAVERGDLRARAADVGKVGDCGSIRR